jgi:hypothetical protein
MKKFIILSLLSLAVAVNASTYSTNILTANNTFIPTPAGNYGIVNYVLLSSTSTNAGSVVFYDSNTTNSFRVTAAYTGITTYATNLVVGWTNYYGVTNLTTVSNLTLVDVANTTAAATNSLPATLSLSTAANTTTAFQGMNAVFTRGILVTNTSAGTVTVTVGYSQ